MYNGLTYIGIAITALGLILFSVFAHTNGSTGLILLIAGGLLLVYGTTRKSKAANRNIESTH